MHSPPLFPLGGGGTERVSDMNGVGFPVVIRAADGEGPCPAGDGGGWVNPLSVHTLQEGHNPIGSPGEGGTSGGST
jgi:hypothetical protein